ncbi:hypothetical protein ABID23_000994 [Bartonella silvatica]|uniref:Uncharacterized protein n=1 Tax=Bartonella silvatica TaxID=357760 RepID=A0ABV2HH77_9HYPH
MRMLSEELVQVGRWGVYDVLRCLAEWGHKGARMKGVYGGMYGLMLF